MCTTQERWILKQERIMNKISKYAQLIKELPIDEQSVTIKKDVWKKIAYKGKDSIEALIFSNSSEIELSRLCIKNEIAIRKKIVMILMWGYPTGGRRNHIQNVLLNLDKLVNIFSDYNNKSLTLKEFENLVSTFNSITGLGISTWTKFLYFFEISVERCKCEIFDLKIVKSLKKRQFVELPDKDWVHNASNYLEYIHLIDEVSSKIKVRPDQIELFLFYFNLHYKFDN